MNKHSIAGAVIFYNPASHVFDYVQTYLPYLKRLFILDNSATPAVLPFPLKSDPKISYHFLNGNKGIGAALNFAARIAREQGYEYFLTMDQDGWFSARMARLYFEYAQSVLLLDRVAVLSPAHEKKEELADTSFSTFSEPDTVMTSGNLIHLRAFEQIGGFDESLFIDTVDHDYCLRAKLSGFRVLQFDRIYLEHRLGRRQTVERGGRAITIITHPPERLYTITRNNLKLWRRYARSFPDYIRSRRRFYFSTTLKNLFCYQDRKAERVCHAFRGLWHFLCGRYGRAGEMCESIITGTLQSGCRSAEKILPAAKPECELTILTLFSGDHDLLSRYAEALQHLKKPRQTQLLFIHNADEKFHVLLQALKADVFYYPVKLAEEFLGQLDVQSQKAKAAVCGELYEFAKTQIRGRDLLILEHDILPSTEALGRLFQTREFYGADMVSALTVSRITGEHQAWRMNLSGMEMRPVWVSTRPKRVSAASFGCLLMRSEIFKGIPMMPQQAGRLFFGCDLNAGVWAKERGLRWFVDGRVRPAHVGKDGAPAALGRFSNTLIGPVGVLRQVHETQRIPR